MVKKTTIPADSLMDQFRPADYTDAYCREVATDKPLSPDDIMVAFWTRQPAWVAAMFRLRNFLVRFIGLKGDEQDAVAFERCIREGGTFGFTSIPAKNDNETVMLLTDKHLDAYLSVYVAGKKVYVITLVKFRRTLGRVYFLVIRPFHAVIVRSLLKNGLNKAI